MASERLHGVVRGRLIELDKSVGLPDGTEVEIIIIEESYRDAWKRQKDLMKRGFNMGQRRSIQREELHERR